MRWLFVIFTVLLLLLQYPLWLDKGGWLMAREESLRLEERQRMVRQMEARNADLEAEVRDLKEGTEAIEERARFELGMVKSNEDFIRYPDSGMPTSTTAPGVPVPSLATP
ncbi:MAG: cell division protein FtsB [Zoogloeaceae bacterium]|jgi:cell division protein FtsB|nr:cell division protein FtsB [Zoogloeaceae bacterium]